VNASAPEARADKTADIEGFFVGQVSAGDKFAEFLKTIDSPVTMEEYKVLKRIANGDPELLDPELIYPAEQRTIAALAARDKIDAGVDWRTVTPAPIGIAGGPVFAAILTGKGWQKTSENLTSFITDLGNDNFDTRQRADDAIRALLDTAIQKGDYTRLWLILDRVEDQQVNNDSAEVKFRLGRILRDYGSVLDEGSLKLFKKAKQGAANGAAGAP
jgi:hypothetical protein